MARNISADTKKTIGETLKQLRQERLWTQADLASRIETTTISIGRWEKNLTRPGLHFQQKLCEIFGKSPEELGFLPQSDHEESATSHDQHQETVPNTQEQATRYEHAQRSAPSLPSVPPIPHPRVRLLRHAVSRPRRSLFFALAALSILMLLSGVFFVRQSAFSSTPQQSSCHTPSSRESATAIYAQITCKQPLYSLAMDHQNALQWDENDHCAFTHGAYHVLLSPTIYVTECFAHISPSLRNFALQANITILKGYSGGLVFNAEGPSANWDVVTSRLPIDIWGTYDFYLANTVVPCHLTKDTNDSHYCHSPHGTISYGAGVANTMTVVVLDSLVYLYVNGFFIDQAHMPASGPATGYFGVFANGSQTDADVAFAQLQLWGI